jgi:two-component system, LytTR family, response regulator
MGLELVKSSSRLFELWLNGAGLAPSASAAIAARLFENSAIDYLLKPFSDERFHAAVNRVRARIQQLAQLDARADLKAIWLEMLSQASGRLEPAAGRRLFAGKQQRFFFLDLSDVESAVADHNCVTLTVKGETYIARSQCVSWRQDLRPQLWYAFINRC